MELKFLTKQEVLKLKIPDFQRKINVAHRNKMVKTINNEGYSLSPIMINENGEIVDGQHRVSAYLISNSQENLPAIIVKDISKKLFLQLNMGKPVTISHKVFIHEKVQLLAEQYPIIIGSSNLTSIGSSDLARGLFIIDTKTVKQASQKEIFDMLDNAKVDELRKHTEKLLNIKKMYESNLTIKKKFLQKYFLYFCFLDSVVGLDNTDFERTVPRLSTSLGGDIGLPFNQQIFLDCFNYRKRNKLDISIFKQ